MTIETARAKISAAVWQAVAQSGVDLSALSGAQQAALVSAVADNVLLVVDDLLGELGPPAATNPEESEPPAEAAVVGAEQVLWAGRPFLSIGTTYEVTSERIVIRHGLLNLRQENYDLYRIQDVDFTQHVGERMVNIGDITLRGADASDPTVVLRNIHSPTEVHNIIRTAVADARKRHRVYTRDVL